MSKIREIGVDLAKAKKYREAMYLLEKAASNGDIDAINDMGVVHERNRNYEKAMEMYQFAALFGSSALLHMLQL